MATPARFSPAPLRPAKIGTCDAEFEVTAPNGPLSSPETLLAAVRREILPALSDLLDAPPWCDLDIDVDHIEIDLGEWPDDPVWSEVRYVLAHKLETALSRYLVPNAESGLKTGATPRSVQQHSARHRYPMAQTPADMGHEPSNDQMTGATGGTGQDLATPPRHPAQDTPGFTSRRARNQSSGTSQNAISQRGISSTSDVSQDGAQDSDASPPPQGRAGQTVPAPTSQNAASQQGKSSASDVSRDGAQDSRATPRPQDGAGQTSPSPTSRKSGQERPPFAAGKETAHDPARTPALHDPAQDHTARTTPRNQTPDQTSDTSPVPASRDGAVNTNNPKTRDDTAYDPESGISVTSARHDDTINQTTPTDVPGNALDQNPRPVTPEGASDHQSTGSDHSPDASDTKGARAQDQAPSSHTDNHDQISQPITGENRDQHADQSHIQAFLAWCEGTEMTVSVQDITARFKDHPQERRALRAWLKDSETSRALQVNASETLRALVIRALAQSAQDRRAVVPGQTAPAPAIDPSDITYIRALIRQVVRDRPRGPDALLILDQVRTLHPDFFASVASTTDQAALLDAPTPAHKRAITTVTARLAASLRRAGHARQSAAQKAAELIAAMLLRDAYPTPAPNAPRSIDPAAVVENSAVTDTAIDHDPTALTALADLFDLNKSHPIGPALMQIFNTDPVRFLSRLDSAEHTPHLRLILADPACDLITVLTAKPLNGAQLRVLFRADQNRVRAAVMRLSPAQMLALAQQSLPDSADLLSDALDKLAQSAKSPANALYRAVLALFQDHPLDIEALMTSAPTDAPDTAQNSADDQHRTDQTSGDARKSPDQTQARERSELPFAHAAHHRARATETPLETLLALDGFTPEETQRVLGTALDAAGPEQRHARPSTSGKQARPDATDRDNAPQTHRSEESAMSRDTSDAELRTRLGHLADLAQDPSEQVFAAALQLIWRVWPHAPSNDDTAAETANFQPMRLLIDTATHAQTARQSLARTLAVVLKKLVAEDDTRAYALRVASARLASLPGPDADGLQRMTRAALEQIIADPALAETEADDATPTLEKTAHLPVSEPEIEPDTLLISETAGLVLLHPFYVLLFERLKIEREGKRLASLALPRAFGLLAALGGTENAPTIDPLHRVLLGLPPTGPVPLPEPPDADAITLMDGLLRSVIDRWGRLGATSPDGLRDTFLRRTGSLRQDENGVHLRVTPGPFDMLLDALPWSPGPVTLPWMPLPCHVTWREDKDA